MNQTSKPKKRSHNLVSAIIVTLVLLTGLSLLLYPTVADYINSLDYKRDIEDYQREVQLLDDSQRQAMLDAARAWNQELSAASNSIGDLDVSQRVRYRELLDPTGTGVLGYVQIPAIDVYLPIYHGTEESVLQSGVGHLEGSSLPVGGVGTHVLLSGHTGLPSSKLFSNIDRLKPGDTFSLHVLGEEMTYRVESTVVLLPEEAENQVFEAGKELCTLITCTPYGVNSHRLLVRGVRVETPRVTQPQEESAPSTLPVEKIPAPMPPILKIVIIAVPVILAIAVLIAVRRKLRKRKTP